jgi:hypothetical protein
MAEKKSVLSTITPLSKAVALILLILLIAAGIFFFYSKNSNNKPNTTGWKTYDSKKFSQSSNNKIFYTFMYPPEFGSGDPTVLPEFNRTLRNPNWDIPKTKALPEKYVDIRIGGVQPKSEVEKLVRLIALNKQTITHLVINNKKVVLMRSENPQYLNENLYYTPAFIYIYLTPQDALRLDISFRNQPYDEKLIKDILSTVSIKK